MNALELHFFPKGSRKNSTVIKSGDYEKGSANLTPNAQNLVNKLWVIGGKAISEVYYQNINVNSTTPIELNYYPRNPITVIIDGSEKTLGIQNITEPGTCDFLINASEKLLIPDLVTSGTGTVSYKYEYPIKLLLEDPVSQSKYGVFEDKTSFDVEDEYLCLELGLQYLYKYSEPVISGSISPIHGTYKPGETIHVIIPDLNVDNDLFIKEAAYESSTNSPRNIKIRLQLETPERDVRYILKDMNQRLSKLEKTVFMDNEGPIVRYVAKEEVCNWTELNNIPQPIQAVDFLFLHEDIIENSYAAFYPNENLYPSDSLYPY